MSIYSKLLTLQQTVGGLAKDATGQSGNAKYPYVSGNKLLKTIRPKMSELGLILFQEVEDTKTVQTEKGMLYIFTFKFTWHDTETGEEVENKFVASGMNSWEKGVGSAYTYAERYYLLKTFHIPTDEDDVDTHNYDDYDPFVQAAPASAPAAAPAVAPAAAPAAPQLNLDTMLETVKVMTNADEIKDRYNQWKDKLNENERKVLFAAVMANPACIAAAQANKGRTVKNS